VRAISVWLCRMAHGCSRLSRERAWLRAAQERGQGLGKQNRPEYTPIRASCSGLLRSGTTAPTYSTLPLASPCALSSERSAHIESGPAAPIVRLEPYAAVASPSAPASAPERHACTRSRQRRAGSHRAKTHRAAVDSGPAFPRRLRCSGAGQQSVRRRAKCPSMTSVHTTPHNPSR
jgi:hypothetical protein